MIYGFASIYIYGHAELSSGWYIRWWTDTYTNPIQSLILSFEGRLIDIDAFGNLREELTDLLARQQ